MNVYYKKEENNEIIFFLEDFLKNEDKSNKEDFKKTLYGKVKRYMSLLPENEAKLFFQEIQKNNFLNLMRIERILTDLDS